MLMRSKIVFLLVLFILICFMPILSGCGSSPAVSTSTSGSGSSSGSGTGSGSGSGTGSGTTVTGQVTLSGTVRTNSSVSLLSTQTVQDAGTPAPGYTILATDVSTGSGTRSATSSTGAYSLSIDAQATYVFVLLNANNQLEAVVTTKQVKSESQVTGVLSPQAKSYVVTGVQVNSSQVENKAIKDAADIAINKGAAFFHGKGDPLKATLAFTPVDKYVTQMNADNTGAAATGGDSGNFGKGTTTAKPSGVTGSTVDKDLDGIPDIIDPDKDGNGVLDALEEIGTSTTALSSRIQRATLVSTLYANYHMSPPFNSAGAGKSDTHAFQLIFEVVPVSGKESEIASVVMASLPSYKDKIEVNYMPENVIETGQPSFINGWKGTKTPYQLFKSRYPGSSQIMWQIFTKPGYDNVKVGDVFVVRVTYTDATVEEFPLIVGYKFSDISSLKSYQLAGDASATPAPTPAVNGKGTQEQPISIPGDKAITLTWNFPRDENGQIMPIKRSNITVFFSVSDTHEPSNPGGLPSQNTAKHSTVTIPIDTIDTSTGTVTFTPNTLFTLKEKNPGFAVKSFAIEMLISINGSNTSQYAYFNIQ